MRELFPLTGLITAGGRRPKTSRQSQLLYANSSFGRLSEYGRGARGIVSTVRRQISMGVIFRELDPCRKLTHST